MRPCVAIAGATGFIGSEVLSLFKGEPVELYSCSRHGGTLHDHEIHSVDITNAESFMEWVSGKKADALIYLSSLIPRSFADSDWTLFEQNLQMHKSILDAWTEHKFHLIYASTASVYSRNTPVPFSEEAAVMPDNYYSISKYTGEMLFYREFLSSGLPLTILRLAAPYGTGNRLKTVINIFIERSLRHEDLVLYGTGSREQDFIHVKDVARAFWQAFTEKKPGTYNIATGRAISMKELAHLVVEVSHSNSRITYSGTEDPQEHIRVSIDVSKSQNNLNFFPGYSMRGGLIDCIDEYRSIQTGQ